ncbi:MAG: general secretion pathway protein GspD [Deltaproteobacteria bacterium]|nr:general secretion pathway protein GspD [Deltaproteobacteria bacterium]MBZ0219816.1 general secretion pathway protein GspD [Deltaproteobacteria bacterium]
MARDADKLASLGQWDEAVLIYRDLYQKDPADLSFRLKYHKAKFEAAQIHHHRGEEHLEKGNHEAALLEFQAALLLEPSLEKSRASMNRTRRVMDSLYYYGKGLEALTNGKERDAKAAFKRAIDLNPENHAAAMELEKLKSQQKLVLDGFELSIRSTAPITLEFREAGVKKAFEVVSKLSGINFMFDSEVRDERITVFLKDATFQQALDLLLMTSKLGKKVVNENTIIIYPANAQKIAQYEELMIKVFYLSNSDAKKTVNLLKTMLRARDIAVHEELNAIMVRARPDVIDLAQKVLDSIDLADSEVVLEVSILEINRTKASNLGIDLSPDALTASIPTTAGSITLRELGKLSSGDLLVTLPSAILNIKKEDLDANILANPRIRVKNNGKARIHIGDRVPIITTTVNQGVTSENIQYQDVGLKLTVEPTVRQSDEVDLKLGLEVSSLGTKTVTSAGTVAYQIGTRNTETMLRLRDGETQIFGGLINDEERKSTAKLPLIGDVPLLGRLFSNVDDSSVKTEVLLSITPHVVRRLEVPDEPGRGFMSGRDEFPSARPALEGFSAEQSAPEEPSRPVPVPMPEFTQPQQPFSPPPLQQ